MRISGRALVVGGDDINTDIIYPGRYLTVTDPEEQAKHIFEGLGDEMPARIRAYPILVAGWNLGPGSSREQAATGLLAAGVQLVVAKSFARIFFRNAINTGLPLIESLELADLIHDDDEVTVDLVKGEAEVKGHRARFEPLPAYLRDILDHGGLWGYFEARRAAG
jgi:3-isopropylmalate/(R)-2-methylmalate dehydratase small subunit